MNSHIMKATTYDRRAEGRTMAIAIVERLTDEWWIEVRDITMTSATGGDVALGPMAWNVAMGVHNFVDDLLEFGGGKVTAAHEPHDLPGKSPLLNVLLQEEGED